MNFFRKSKNPNDFKKLEQLYDLWIETHNKKTKRPEELKNIHFNNQVRAPYLLVYTQKENVLTDSQKNTNITEYFQMKNSNSCECIQSRKSYAD